MEWFQAVLEVIASLYGDAGVLARIGHTTHLSSNEDTPLGMYGGTSNDHKTKGWFVHSAKFQ